MWFFCCFFCFVLKFKSEENNDFLLRRIVIICSTSWLEWKCWGHGSVSLSSSEDYSKKVKRKPLCEVEISPFGGNRAGLEYEATIQDVHPGNNLKLFPKHKFLCKYTQFKPDWMSPEKKILSKLLSYLKSTHLMCYSSMESDYLLCGRLFVWELFLTAAVGKEKKQTQNLLPSFITLIPFLNLTSFYADRTTKNQLLTKVSQSSRNRTPWLVTGPIPLSNAMKTHFLSPEYFPPLLVNVYQLL